MMSNNSRYWTTKSLPLAAFIFAKGGTMVGVHVNNDQAVFAFVNTLELQAHITEHKCGPALIDARLYNYSLRQLEEQVGAELMEFYGEA